MRHHHHPMAPIRNVIGREERVVVTGPITRWVAGLGLLLPVSIRNDHTTGNKENDGYTHSTKLYGAYLYIYIFLRQLGATFTECNTTPWNSFLRIIQNLYNITIPYIFIILLLLCVSRKGQNRIDYETHTTRPTSRVQPYHHEDDAVHASP